MKVNLWVIIAALVVITLVLLFSNRIADMFTKPQTTIGNFFVDKNNQVCTELNRTIIYMFGSTTCPHCLWEDPVIKAVTAKFRGVISFHENIDNANDRDVFKSFSPDGFVPLVVIGCKYYRVGSGEDLGEEQETKVLTALICSLTNREPSDVCSPVSDLINQIG